MQHGARDAITVDEDQNVRGGFGSPGLVRRSASRRWGSFGRREVRGEKREGEENRSQKNTVCDPSETHHSGRRTFEREIRGSFQMVTEAR